MWLNIQVMTCGFIIMRCNFADIFGEKLSDQIPIRGTDILINITYIEREKKKRTGKKL